MAGIPPAPPDALEIFLAPGEFWFGGAHTRIRTLLGSCVAIVLWHPTLKIGGMCHFMLPRRLLGRPPAPPDGRYAEEAMQLFMQELQRSGTRPADYRTRLFGAGRMLRPGSRHGPMADVAARNMEAAQELLQREGFAIESQDLGGQGHRNVVFDLWSGEVWLKRAPAGSAALA